MLFKASTFSVARIAAALLLLLEVIFILGIPRHKCSDLAFLLHHPNRTVTVTPLNPSSTYSDLLIFTYHNARERLLLNNADCHLHITGVKGMERRQLQFLKPYIIRDVIRHTRSPHVAYIDWDANFIRRPRGFPNNLVVQSNPNGYTTNTGLLIFYYAERYIDFIKSWIDHELPHSHDQWTWALTERDTNIPLSRTADGDYGENYNWNVLDKSKTSARCNKVIFFLTYFRLLLTFAIIFAVLAKVLDFYSMKMKGQCPRRVYLSVILVLAIVLSVLFRADYHEQVDMSSCYESERVCAIPELALKEEGLLVTRRGTTTGLNKFLRVAIKVFGLGPVTSSLSFWFSLLAGLRTFARVMLAIEVLSLASLRFVKRYARAESVFWCTLVQWRDYDRQFAGRDVIGKYLMNGEVHVGLTRDNGAAAVTSMEKD